MLNDISDSSLEGAYILFVELLKLSVYVSLCIVGKQKPLSDVTVNLLDTMRLIPPIYQLNDSP